ncbi:RNA polymerase sigma factor [Dyadobacter sp. CY312]|uniref:RNA polymerase sigma factor n=1 Tax=Dyadobacter sp. CY312 TaxID=2907303 RepID=UPI001F22AC2F|nr:sigma-70 family RNA polymerase sigma factor [Dyadobacter sp. CY312]MCE7041127.1 sigma-70 family RNA polymerase sigma factor [Dyadobacter sp. CY312]
MTFEEIYKSYWNKIFRVCMGYVNDRDLAQDIAQETFITVWQQLPKFRNESSIGTWMYRIAANHCLRQIEKTKRLRRDDFPAQLAVKEEPAPDENVQLLYQYISELQEIDRLIISMELEELPQAEIARVVGMTDANVRVRVHRIKEKLILKFSSHGRR